MPAPKGHKPYKGCETGGRPLKYTTEVIEAYADELIEWFMQDESRFWLKKFAIEKRVSITEFLSWIEINEKFKLAYEQAKAIQEDRIFSGCMMKAYDSGMSKFALSTHHNWVDKTETKISGDAQNPLAFAMSQVENTSKDLVHE